MDINAVDVQRLPRNVIDNKLASQYQVLVLGKRGNRLFIGGADPTDQEAVERIKFATQLSPEWVILEHDKLTKILEAAPAPAPPRPSRTSSAATSSSTSTTKTPPRPETQEVTVDVEDAPVVRFLQKMLIDAINARASDLHFEPYEYHYRVRFRVDGELREITQPPIAIKDKLASRIKVISRMDIAENRVPQDGRMKLKFGNKSDRLPGQHAAHAVRREDRDPDPGLLERQARHRGPGLREDREGPAAPLHPARPTA